MISVNPWKLNEEYEVTTCTHSIRVLQNKRFSKTKPNNYIASNQPCQKLLLNPITICNTQPIHIIEDSETTIYINMNEFFNQYKLIIRPTLRPFKNTGKKKKKTIKLILSPLWNPLIFVIFSYKTCRIWNP